MKHPLHYDGHFRNTAHYVLDYLSQCLGKLLELFCVAFAIENLE